MCEGAMLEQAVQAFGQRAGTVILKRSAVSKTVIDVETAAEVVRITQHAAGSITLVGWYKVGRERGAQREPNGRHYVISGVYFRSSGWRFAGTTFTSNEYSTVKSHLPK